jgi:DNA-binding FadR family transcriptional regulator
MKSRVATAPRAQAEPAARAADGDVVNMNVRERSERLSNVIYRQLFEDIKGGRFAPGDRLPTERRIMLQYDASRATVRKALSRLVEDGYISRQTGSGSYVMRTSGKDEESTIGSLVVSPLDVLEARVAIEPGFADLIVLRATEADFVRMELCLSAAERATDLESFRRAGYSFHLELARSTRNPLLVRIFEMVIDARARAGWDKLRELNDDRPTRLAQVAANRRLLAVLRERDAGKARELVRTNIWRMITRVAQFSAATNVDG